MMAQPHMGLEVEEVVLAALSHQTIMAALLQLPRMGWLKTVLARLC